MTSPVVFAVLLACAGVVTVLAAVAVLSRHQKAAAGGLDLVGAIASVETTLDPEGAVLVRGELWRALSRTGVRVSRGRSVRVVGASSHLLEVEPTR